jgi:hypothetical protein
MRSARPYTMPERKGRSLEREPTFLLFAAFSLLGLQPNTKRAFDERASALRLREGMKTSTEPSDTVDSSAMPNFRINAPKL